MHYLEAELNDLIRSDPRIFTFLQKGSLDGLWYWDLEDPETEWMSAEFWSLFGYDPDAMPHKADAWMDAIHPDDLATAYANFEAHVADPAHPYDQIVRYRHKTEDRWITVRCRGIAIRDASEKAVRMLGAHTDLTALKEQEVALRRANSALAAGRAAAESSLNAKTALLETLSHEIRTSLNAILGLSELLGRQDLTDRPAQYAQTIHTSATHLVGLMNDVLSWAQIDAGLIADQSGPLDVTAVLTAMRDLYGPEADRRGLSLRLDKVDVPVPIAGSERGVRHVLTNLVSNALKFTTEGEISLTATLVEQGEELILDLRVADTGRGVSPDDATRIFERFGKAGHNTHDLGAGLGLTIAYELCRGHGGRLSMTDTPGGGATFIASFVVTPLPQVAAAE